MLFVVAVAVAVAVVMLLFVLKRRARPGNRGDLLGPPPGLGRTARPAPPPPPAASTLGADSWSEGAAPIGGLPDHVAAEARELLAQHRKLEAVKLIRAATGCSLEQAVDQVERL